MFILILSIMQKAPLKSAPHGSSLLTLGRHAGNPPSFVNIYDGSIGKMYICASYGARFYRGGQPRPDNCFCANCEIKTCGSQTQHTPYRACLLNSEKKTAERQLSQEIKAQIQGAGADKNQPAEAVRQIVKDIRNRLRFYTKQMSLLFKENMLHISFIELLELGLKRGKTTVIAFSHFDNSWWDGTPDLQHMYDCKQINNECGLIAQSLPEATAQQRSIERKINQIMIPYLQERWKLEIAEGVYNREFSKSLTKQDVTIIDQSALEEIQNRVGNASSWLTEEGRQMLTGNVGPTGIVNDTDGTQASAAPWLANLSHPQERETAAQPPQGTGFLRMFRNIFSGIFRSLRSFFTKGYKPESKPSTDTRGTHAD